MFKTLFALAQYRSVANFKTLISAHYSTTTTATATNSMMNLPQVIKKLEQFADLRLACSWDNVGMLVEPSDPSSLLVRNILVTNDLTEPVVDEAIRREANLIITYHPIIFSPLKRLTQNDWKERCLVKCIERRMAVYSPHTAWDAIEGGINDWMLSAFETKKVVPIETIAEPVNGELTKSLKINVDYGPSKDKLISKASSHAQAVRFLDEKIVSGPDGIKMVELEFLASPQGVVSLIELIKLNYAHDASVIDTLRINDLSKPMYKSAGYGRIGYLNQPITMQSVVDKLKVHFNMKHLRLALANGKTMDDTVKVIGVCAGSGSKMLNNKSVDLLVTGEFGHHEVLHEVNRGVSVILTDHTNCERGYHAHFKQQFAKLLAAEASPATTAQINIILSEVDRDPLAYV